jgi:hypothetical protein
VDLPRALTPTLAAIGVWVAAASGRALTGIVPGVVAAVTALAVDAGWRRRGKRWHDPVAIAGLLPALAAGLWIGIGGLALDVARGAGGRLALEVGPGLALTGLATTLISYHGRHRPPPA